MGIAAEKWLEAQQGVIGSALIDPVVVPIVLAQTSAKDYSGVNLAVYQAMASIFAAGKPVDPITVADKLGGEYSKYLMQLMEVTPTAANVKAYIEICRKQSRIHRLREIGGRMAVSTDSVELQKLLEEAAATNMEQQSFQATPIYQAFCDFAARKADERQPKFLRWPLKELNDLLYVEPGDFVLLAGKPSAGKTAFALQTAWTLAETQKVGFFSLETGERKLMDRQVSAVSGVPLENIKRNALSAQHWDSIISQKEQFKRRRLDFITKSGMDVSELQAYAAAKKYDVIFIDYLHLLSEGKRSPYEEVSRISMSLHRFSQTSGCCVVGLSQLNRGDKDKKGAPDMSWLRDSGQLEQDADAVLILYLEDEKNPNSRRILRCAKNKEGERFSMRLDFDGRTQRFAKASDFGGSQKEIRRAAQQTKSEQLRILPPDTFVPFEEGRKA